MSKTIFDTENAKIYVGNAERLDMLPDESVDLVVTSPPYNIGHGKGGGGGYHWDVEDWYEDSMTRDEYMQWQINCLKEMFRVVKPTGSLFYNHKVVIKEKRGLHPWEWLRETPWELVQQITWDRGSTMNHRTSCFHSIDELIFWMAKGDYYFDKKVGPGMTSVWRFPFNTNSWHPCSFPKELPSRCIRAASRPGDVVLDPFSGGGTTVLTARELGRIGIGVEKSEEYATRSCEQLMQIGMGI